MMSPMTHIMGALGSTLTLGRALRVFNAAEGASKEVTAESPPTIAPPTEAANNGDKPKSPKNGDARPSAGRIKPAVKNTAAPTTMPFITLPIIK